LKLRQETGSNVWIPLTGLVACSAALVVLLWQTYLTAPSRLWILAVMAGLALVVEWLYRTFRRGAMRLRK